MSIRLGMRVDSYIAATKAAERATTGFSRATQRNLTRVGTQMQGLGRSMTMFVSAPIVAAGAFAIKAAVDWESAWAGVTKTVDGTAEQLSELEQGLRDMSKELPATHAEIAAVAEAAGALGIATEDIEFFTRTMIDLGETTDLTSDQAATAIAQMMNVMQTAPGDVDNLASALVHLGNNGASTESQILDMATRIAASGQIVGLSEAEVLGFANALASVGIEAEAGGSAFSRVLQDMAKAAQTGGDELDVFAEVAGMSAAQFATAFREDPASAIVAFVAGLGDIQAAGGNVFGVLEALGLSDVRVSRALLSMATSGDVLTTSLQQGEQAWSDNTALADEAAKRYETAGARFEMVRNKIVDLFIDLGNMMLPAVEAIVDAIGNMAEAFQGLPAPVQVAVGGFLGLVAAAGPMIFIAGTLVKNLVAIRSAMTLMGPAAGKAAGALGAIGLAATAGFIGYQIFTAEQRKTDEVTRNVSGSLLANMSALLLTGDAAGFAAGEIDAVAIAQEALALSLGDGFEGLTDAFATFNVSGEDMVTLLAQMDQAPVMALDNLARSFGFTAEQADRLAQTNIGSSFGASTEVLAAQIQAPIEQVEAFREALFKLQGAADNVDMNAIAQQFLNSQVTAHGYEESLVGAAEAQSEQNRTTGDAMAVLYAWTQIMAGADDETQNAILTSGEYRSAIADLPPELQALMDGADGAAGAVDELAMRQASAIDTSSNYQDYLSDIAHIWGEYSAGLDEALGGTREWVRAHDDFSGSLLTFNDQIEDASAGLDYNTEAGLANRSAVLDMADGVIAMTQANLDAGVSTAETTREYESAREALLDAAEAAGLSREETEALISAYGLVPDLVTTAVKIANLALTQWQIDRYLDKLDEIPEEDAVIIEALLNEGQVDAAIAYINSIPSRRDVAINPYLTQTSLNVRITTTGGASPHRLAAVPRALGGYQDRPEFALWAEDGPEVMFPLNDPNRIQDLWSDPRVSGPMMAALGNLSSAGSTPMVSVPSSGGDVHSIMNVNVNMPPGSNGDDVVRALRQYERRSGPIPITVR